MVERAEEEARAVSLCGKGRGATSARARLSHAAVATSIRSRARAGRSTGRRASTLLLSPLTQTGPSVVEGALDRSENSMAYRIQGVRRTRAQSDDRVMEPRQRASGEEDVLRSAHRRRLGRALVSARSTDRLSNPRRAAERGSQLEMTISSPIHLRSASSSTSQTAASARYSVTPTASHPRAAHTQAVSIARTCSLSLIHATHRSHLLYIPS